MNFKEFLHIYALGCIGYMFIEILWRGYTHWTMGLLGGICLCAIYIIDMTLAKASLFVKAFFSAGCITTLELLTGILVNLTLKLNVWDYSDLKFNFMGQISLIYSILWYYLCIPALILCKILRHRVFGVLSLSRRHLTKIFERQPTLRQR